MAGAPAVEPIPDAPAAAVRAGAERLLVVADYHAGIEAGLRADRGVSVESHADRRRERLLDLVARVDPDRIVVIGDLMHSIGGPGGAERGEIELLIESLSVPLVLVKGNHDGDADEWMPDAGTVTITDPTGVRIGAVGFAHGHVWPSRAVLEADVVCLGHEHPAVRIEDEVGGSRAERVWLRGRLAREPFVASGRYDDLDDHEPAATVFPAYNDRSGGTWVNVPGQSFLAPFLPAALPDAEAYLLDGTRLGDHRSV